MPTDNRVSLKIVVEHPVLDREIVRERLCAAHHEAIRHAHQSAHVQIKVGRAVMDVLHEMQPEGSLRLNAGLFGGISILCEDGLRHDHISVHSVTVIA